MVDDDDNAVDGDEDEDIFLVVGEECEVLRGVEV